MKNYKPTVEVSIGNPAKEGETYLIFYETGNKIAYRVRIKDAYFGADNQNNFVIKGQGFIQDLEDYNIKTINHTLESESSVENLNDKTINGNSMSVNLSNDFVVNANNFIVNAEEIFLRGKTTIGNTTQVNDEKTEGDDRTEDVYDYDSVMTANKFKHFYEKKFIPFFKAFVKLVNQYNLHTHGIIPTEKPVILNNQDLKIDENNLTQIQTSQNLKVL